jgi:hypothetical protein
MRRSFIAVAAMSLSLADARVSIAQSLRPASSIRVTTRGTQIQGRFVVANAGTLVMETDGKPASTIATSDITQLEVRGSHAGEGAKVLGVTGLITGAAFGAALVTGLCETSSCNDDILPAMGVVGLTFGAVGALGGAVIGSFIPKWKSVDPSRIGQVSPRLSAAPTFRMRGASDREIGLRFALRP